MSERPRHFQMSVLEGIAGKEARDAAKLANEELSDTTKRIRAIFSNFDPIPLLSRLAFSSVVEQQKFGDMEAESSFKIHELELLQALALTVQPGAESDHRKMAEAVHELMVLARQNSHAFQKMALLRLTDDDMQNRKIAALERIRATTQTVRGPRHGFQTRAYLRDVASRLDSECAAQLGFAVSDFTRFFEKLAFDAEGQIQKIRGSVRRWLTTANPELCVQYFAEDNPTLRNHPLLTELSVGTMSREEIRTYLWNMSEDLFLSIFSVYSPDGDDDSSNRRLFRTLSNRALRVCPGSSR